MLCTVIFQNLAEKYPEDAHIECKYTLTRTYEPSGRDWIGLYKVKELITIVGCSFRFRLVAPTHFGWSLLQNLVIL